MRRITLSEESASRVVATRYNLHNIRQRVGDNNVLWRCRLYVAHFEAYPEISDERRETNRGLIEYFILGLRVEYVRRYTWATLPSSLSEALYLADSFTIDQ
jgi:hypothetical protein